jgi:hypothetical protein
VVGAAYSGGTGTGTLLDLANGSQADGALEGAQTAPSITTTVNNDMVVFGAGEFGAGNMTTVVGFCTNLRGVLGGVALADAVKATAGATGTTHGTTQGTQDYAAIHAAIISDTGGAAGLPPGLGPAMHMEPTQMMPTGW